MSILMSIIIWSIGVVGAGLLVNVGLWTWHANWQYVKRAQAHKHDIDVWLAQERGAINWDRVAERYATSDDDYFDHAAYVGFKDGVEAARRAGLVRKSGR